MTLEDIKAAAAKYIARYTPENFFLLLQRNDIVCSPTGKNRHVVLLGTDKRLITIAQAVFMSNPEYERYAYNWMDETLIELCNIYNAKPRPNTRKHRKTKQERIQELKSMPYREYLQTPEWKRLREKRLRRDNWQCVRCGSAINLQVHHINYMHKGEREEIDDVITLCWKCHNMIHERDIKG